YTLDKKRWLYFKFSHPIILGDCKDGILYSVAGKTDKLPAPLVEISNGEFRVDLSTKHGDIRPDQVIRVGRDTVRSKLTGQPNEPMTDLVLPFQIRSKLADEVVWKFI